MDIHAKIEMPGYGKHRFKKIADRMAKRAQDLFIFWEFSIKEHINETRLVL